MASTFCSQLFPDHFSCTIENKKVKIKILKECKRRQLV